MSDLPPPIPTGSRIRLRVDGRTLEVNSGTVVAAALLRAGTSNLRRSTTGQPRGPLCGMGICYECRVTINGQPHQRSCFIPCEEGMEILTGD